MEAVYLFGFLALIGLIGVIYVYFFMDKKKEQTNKH